MNDFNLNELLVPRREDGGIDNSYIPIIKGLLEQCDDRHIRNLSKFWNRTNELEIEAGGSALHLVAKSFALKVDNWERNILNKSIREALKELGFKPSKATKLMSAGEFLSNKAGYDEVKYMFLKTPRLKHEGVRELANEIDEYHSKNSVSSLYELSRTNKTGRRKAFKYYQKTERYSQKEKLRNFKRSIR